MTLRRRLVTVPGTSANLGPGFDVFAAALAMHLELEVWEGEQFGIDTGEDTLPRDRSNLCVRAFEELHPADGVQFEMTSQIPLARGLGSSAAAIVAGLMAADHMYELALSREEIYEKAVAIEGHPDNVAAAIYGGFVSCPAAENDGLPGSGADRAARGRGGDHRDPGRRGADLGGPRCPASGSAVRGRRLERRGGVAALAGPRALGPGPDPARACRPASPASP